MYTHTYIYAIHNHAMTWLVHYYMTIAHSAFFDRLLLCSSGQPTTNHEGQTCFSVTGFSQLSLLQLGISGMYLQTQINTDFFLIRK